MFFPLRPRHVFASSLRRLPLVFLAVCTASSAAAQGQMPLAAGSFLERGQKYTSTSGAHYITFQADGNVVVYTKANGYVWGMNESAAPFALNAKVGVQADGNFVGLNAQGRVIWSALGASADPGARLDLSASGDLRLVASNGAVVWSNRSHPILVPTPVNFAALQADVRTCRTGVQSLLDNPYRFPDNPATAPAGGRSWSDAFGAFRGASLPACERVGVFAQANAEMAVMRSSRSAMTRSGVNGWPDLFSGARGIVSQGEKVLTDCPSTTGSTFDCAGAATRIGASLAVTKTVMNLLDFLECLPDDGWAHCRALTTPSLRIMGTAAASQSAMTLVKKVYTDMTRLLKPAYPASRLDGYIAYLTNGEPWSELSALPPVGTMMGLLPDGSPRGDETRGGSGADYLWITEQMICKQGVATRNEAFAQGRRSTGDDTYRSFDQVVHEMGHTYDRKFNLSGRINTVYAGGWNPEEQFPYSIQYWFGAPQGSLSQTESAFMNDLFSGRMPSFSCAEYTPADASVGVEDAETAPAAALAQSRPNPFREHTTITFDLPAPGRVSLTVYDLLGRPVAVLASGMHGDGSHQVVWDAGSAPSGVYFYRLETDTATQTRTMTRVR